MKRSLAILAIAAALGTVAWSQAGPPNAPQGARGYGWGMGPAMMGQGYGWGMHGGMMMMGNGWGMAGPAASWRFPGDLAPEQREKITQIQSEAWKQRYALMQQMHTLMWNDGAAPDEQAARKNYETGASLHKQMIDNATETQKRIEAVLTPKQREELRRNGPW